MSKSIVVREYGDPETLKLEEVSVDAPAWASRAAIEQAHQVIAAWTRRTPVLAWIYCRRCCL